MKTSLKILGFASLILIAYVLYVCQDTGLFRSIHNKFEGSIAQKIQIPGVEDIQVSRTDHFALLSSDDRAARRHGGEPKQGHLYYMNLKNPALPPFQLTSDFKKPFYPHGISMIQTGIKRYTVYAINHVGKDHFIEVFELLGDSLVHRQSLQNAAIISPNDLVAINENQFYFTNDHAYTEGLMQLGEEYLGWSASTVYFFDGANYRQVADGIAYANGINYDAKRKLLFVASPRSFLLKVYQVQNNGDLAWIEDIDCGTGVDNIEFAPDGKLWIGCHPSLLTFSAYAEGRKSTAPSEIITVDYRGKGDYDLETVYVNTGEDLSASTVAAVYEDLILVGTVMDGHFLVLEKN